MKIYYCRAITMQASDWPRQPAPSVVTWSLTRSSGHAIRVTDSLSRATGLG